MLAALERSKSKEEALYGRPRPSFYSYCRFVSSFPLNGKSLGKDGLTIEK